MDYFFTIKNIINFFLFCSNFIQLHILFFFYARMTISAFILKKNWINLFYSFNVLSNNKLTVFYNNTFFWQSQNVLFKPIVWFYFFFNMYKYFFKRKHITINTLFKLHKFNEHFYNFRSVTYFLYSFTSKTLSTISNFFYFLLTFFLKFITFKLNIKCVLLFKYLTLKKQSSYFKLINWFVKKYKFLINKTSNFFFYDFLNVILFFFISKDSCFFTKWLKTTLEGINFKMHKFFIYFLSLFFNNFFFYFANRFKLVGFILQVCGKISLGGNSKKKKHLITIGKSSLNTLSGKLSFFNECVWTQTGTLGLTVFLFYV